MATKTLKINGIDVSAHESETILQTAEEHDIRIPTLCHLEGLSNIGACRLCLVEIAGRRGLHPACATPVEEGIEVFTNTEQLKAHRRTILEMLFVEGNHICSVCVSNGHCELQNMAVEVGMDHTHLNYRNPKRSVDLSHERFGLDNNRCILCTRCVRVCDEIEGAHTWDLSGRGGKAHLIADLGQPWGEATSCTSCGKCVHVCPTGALFEKGKAAAEMAKRAEFLPYLSAMRKGQTP